MSGRGEILKLLASENIDGDEMDLGVTMLASLRGRHLDNFAGTCFDDNETILPQRRALHRVGRRSTSIGALECVTLMLP